MVEESNNLCKEMNKMKKSKPQLYDPLIINRVKQYLEENVDQTYLDVGVMTKQLQERYNEYSRRKIAPFRALVEQAYKIVSQSYGMDSQASSGEDSDGSDLEVMDDSTSKNMMSNMMHKLYSKSKPQAPAGKTASEAIDISSDESGDENQRANGTSKHKDGTQSGGKTFRDVTLTKIPVVVTGALEGDHNEVIKKTNKSNNQPPVSGQKRVEMTQSTGNTGQPPKKRKSEHGPLAGPQHQMQQQSQQHSQPQLQQFAVQQRPQHPPQFQFRGANYNQNSNESSQSLLGQQLRGRKYKKEITLRKSCETFQDVGGMEKTLKELCELLMHIKSPDIYFVLGLMPPRGILLHGPPGCGKTLLAHAIAGQLNLPLIEIPATELIAGISGESEERIRDVFEQATTCAPCVLFIDEIDAISSNRSMAQKDMERRIVSQLISSLDNLKLSEGGQSVLVIGATTRPDVLDPALRRVGRFDHEIAIGIPNRKDRKDILTIICEGLSVEPKCDFDQIAELTPGYVGADLLALVSRAATIAVKRKCGEQLRSFQAKAQKNITIVDLDDDADDDAAGDKGDKQNNKNSLDKQTNKDGADKSIDVAGEGETAVIEDNEEVAEVVDEAEVDASKDVDGETPEEANKEGAEANGAEEAEEMEVDDEGKAENCPNTDENVHEESTDKVEGDADEATKKEDEKTEGNKDAAEPKVAVAEDDKLPLPEPSLFELLNWLDNPPEDITFDSEFSITLSDFREAVKVVQPSAKREGFITVPDVTWEDVGSLQDIREELKLAVLAPVKFPEKLARLGLTVPSGVLLCGPPGCGKTLLAKAIANEAGINFISVKGPELMNMYVGESERAVRACFQRARNSAPCVIFFDEFDSLCPKRSDTNEGGSGTRVVNQLLTEMDGVEDRKGVYILAATNRPDIIDPAILRPGRLDTILYVGMPEEEDRMEILKANTKNRQRPVLAEDVDFAELARLTDGYTGADLAGLVRQAAMLALKESMNDADRQLADLCVRKEHFHNAIKMLRPSVNAQDRQIYEELRLKYAAPRTTCEEADVE